MNTIETSSNNIKSLTKHAIDKLEVKHGKKKSWRRTPVANALLSVDTSMKAGDCFANVDVDAKLYNWKSVIVTAIREGLNHLFYGTKL